MVLRAEAQQPEPQRVLVLQIDRHAPLTAQEPEDTLVVGGVGIGINDRQRDRTGRVDDLPRLGVREHVAGAQDLVPRDQ